MRLSDFTHRQQRRESDCLVACTAMILAYLQVPAGYAQLAKLLRARPFGNIRYLETLGLSVRLDYAGDFHLFERYIALGLPVLVNVRTLGWPHWQGEVTYHAVLVVGIDRARDVIYIHDPFFAEAPITLTRTQFMVGWGEQNRQYAVIGLAPAE
jgi:ABC-type bacteriocin/lantibiotic exporter with double-glycine peptidase domain